MRVRTGKSALRWRTGMCALRWRNQLKCKMYNAKCTIEDESPSKNFAFYIIFFAFEPMPHPIATFDITNQCVLRCEHCYFYPSDSADQADLDDAEFLQRVTALRDRHDIRAAFWIGGEPLLRPDLLRKVIPLFQRNAISTSGMVTIPSDLPAAMLVSIDGPKELHDRLRGTGSFDCVMQNIALLPRASFALSVTLTNRTLGAIEHLPALVESTRSMGALIGFHVAPAGDPLLVIGDERDRAVDRLLHIAKQFPAVILNSTSSLEQFRPRNAASMSAGCIYHDRAIAFDPQLEAKSPCTFGSQANCDACGCGVVATHSSRDQGDAASDVLLRALFPKN